MEQFVGSDLVLLTQIHSLKNTITFAGYALLSAEHLCSKCDYYAEHWKPTAVEKEYFV